MRQHNNHESEYLFGAILLGVLAYVDMRFNNGRNIKEALYRAKFNVEVVDVEHCEAKPEVKKKSRTLRLFRRQL